MARVDSVQIPYLDVIVAVQQRTNSQRVLLIEISGTIPDHWPLSWQVRMNPAPRPPQSGSKSTPISM